MKCSKKKDGHQGGYQSKPRSSANFVAEGDLGYAFNIDASKNSAGMVSLSIGGIHLEDILIDSGATSNIAGESK